MDIQVKFDELRKAWISAEDEAERSKIQEQIRELADEFPNDIEKAFYSGLKRVVDEASKGKSERVRETMEPILPAINVAYIADNYFHKTRGWLSQKLTGQTVNNRVATFKTEEIATLADALRDIATKLTDVADKLHK